jgi:carboxypeptidase D
LEGTFQENGVSFLQLIQRTISKTAQPFTWKNGQALPTQNEWSWTNLSSVLYVEQPIGTGFSQGKPTAKVRGFPN